MQFNWTASSFSSPQSAALLREVFRTLVCVLKATYTQLHIKKYKNLLYRTLYTGTGNL